MMKKRELISLVMIVTNLFGCTEPSPPKVQGRAKFFSGATPGAVGSAPGSSASPSFATVPANGTWDLSPDKVTLKLTGIALGDANAPGPFSSTDCTVTYEKAKPGLTQLADCAFATDTGTFTGLDLQFAGTLDIFVNDSVHGFYSTATGIVTSPPAGGAQPWTFPIPLAATSGTFQPSPIVFPTPLVVKDTGTLTLSVVLGGLQFFAVTVNGGATSIPSSAPNVPGMIATIGTLARTEYYSRQDIGTGDSFCASFCASNGPEGIRSVALYYADASTPTIGSLGNNGIGANCPTGGFATIGSVKKSYLGLDAAGNVSWAMGTDLSYATYAAELQMARVSTIGGTTTLYCKAISADPAPPGGSFAAGAPGIAQTPNVVATFVLVGK